MLCARAPAGVVLGLAVPRRAAGAAERVADIDAGVQRALALVLEPDVSLRADRIQRARAFAEQHRGAAERMAQAVQALLR